MILMWIFLILVLSIVAKLVIDKQKQNKYYKEKYKWSFDKVDIFIIDRKLGQLAIYNKLIGL